MKKTKKFSSLAVIIGILFVSALTFTNAFRSGNSKLSVATVFGDENEEDEKDEANNDNEDSDSGEKADKQNDKKVDENDEDDEKKSTEIKKAKTTTQGTSLQKEDDEENDDEDGDQEENDNEDVNEDSPQEKMQELNKDIRKVESRINALSANGVSVTTFTPVLAEIKSLATQAQAAITAKSVGAEALIETADHKLERLNKIVKMSLGDDDENDDEDDATEEIQDLVKKIAKIEATLNAASLNGADVSDMKLALDGAKDLLSQAKEKMTAGDLTGAEALTELADKKLETLKHAMELAFGDDDEEDGDEADEYKNEVAKFVHNLKEIGDVEGGIGQQVNVVAQAQNDSVAKVESSIDDIKDRSGFVKFLVGPNYGSIAEVQAVITENQNRIKVLTDLVAQVADPVVKQVLQDQIKNFQQENTKLQTFVAESDSGISLFGWLVKMFS